MRKDAWSGSRRSSVRRPPRAARRPRKSRKKPRPPRGSHLSLNPRQPVLYGLVPGRRRSALQTL
ncbi:MAG: hypothetical protein DMF92_01525 [Acidobacteria bacterium]|nr:MAG: hypothetical protein DMF92_01525 [Acidobacteriota bacterium]